MSIKALPLFSDLMLIPRVIDSLASVSIREGKIYVRSDKADEICRSLKEYPNIRVQQLGSDELLLLPVELESRVVMVHWPDGKRHAVTIYKGGWVTMFSAEAADSLMAAGFGVHIESAHEDETLQQVLTRLVY